jgi:mono/diheme cytochrome c family protein
MHRRAIALVMTLLTVASAFIAFSCAGPQSASNDTAAPAVDPVERGRYLTTIMSCVDCHTPGYFYGAADTSRWMAGSEIPWGGPWGVVYSANLTPDPETGLGQWTDDQLVTAIRTGARPDGRQLAPIMPWPNFSTLEEADVRAIVAYLRSLPAVVHAEPAPVPPGMFKGAVFGPPPPSAWDAKNLPPPGDAPGH